MDAAARRQAVSDYMHGLQWCLRYYHDGCCSWTWYYPDFYAPLVSDLAGLEELELSFEMGKPLSPLVQLLAVLPPESQQLLPEPYRELMMETESLLIDGYPTFFEVDRNGKQREWEATSLIPFLDERTLHASAASIGAEDLTPVEAKRNRHGESNVFVPSGKPPPDMDQQDMPKKRAVRTAPSAAVAAKQKRVVKGHQAS